MARSSSSRRKTPPTLFNVMVVGASGSGKSSFVNTFLDSLQPHVDHEAQTPFHRYPSTQEIVSRKVTTVSQGTSLVLNFIDTPGFEEHQALEEGREGPVLEYVKRLLLLRFQEETRLSRSTRPKEEQVHACLFFVQPGLVRLSEAELAFAKKLSKYVNVIPVIGKADRYTVSELREMKAVIQRDFRDHSIPTYDFPDDEDQDEDDESHQQNQRLRRVLPFSVVSSEPSQPRKQDGTKVLGREYSWGIVECFNPSHSDMSSLRQALLETHLYSLKEKTYLQLYEDYRTEKL
ncbi:cell division/GTP binding protein, partial [Basidiobolus meristosporus CBS 931.73]